MTLTTSIVVNMTAEVTVKIIVKVTAEVTTLILITLAETAEIKMQYSH